MTNAPYVKLSELCNVNQGLQVPISKRFMSAGENRYFYITVQFLKNSHLEKHYIENPPKATICKESDIIVVRTGSTGQILTGISGCFHNNFFKVNYDKEKVVGKYLYYCLTSKEKQKEMKNRAGITTIPDLNHFMFLDMKIPLPKYSEQEKAVQVLDNLNKKIELNNKINAELESMAKLIYDYWFVQFDFPDANGKPYKSSGGKMVYNEELKREIPDGWEPVSISNLAPIKTGKEDANYATQEGEYHFFTCGERPLLCDDYVFDGKAVLLAGNGSFSVKRYEGKFNAYQRTYVLMPNKDELFAPIYFTVKDRVKNLTSGSRGSIVKFITKGDIEDIYMPLPQDNNLEFSKSLNSLFAQTSILYKQNIELIKLRDWLLPMLINGQVAVNS